MDAKPTRGSWVVGMGLAGLALIVLGAIVGLTQTSQIDAELGPSASLRFIIGPARAVGLVVFGFALTTGIVSLASRVPLWDRVTTALAATAIVALLVAFVLDGVAAVQLWGDLWSAPQIPAATATLVLGGAVTLAVRRAFAAPRRALSTALGLIVTAAVALVLYLVLALPPLRLAFVPRPDPTPIVATLGIYVGFALVAGWATARAARASFALTPGA